MCLTSPYAYQAYQVLCKSNYSFCLSLEIKQCTLFLARVSLKAGDEGEFFSLDFSMTLLCWNITHIVELSKFPTNQTEIIHFFFLIKPQTPADAWRRLFGFETYGGSRKKKFSTTNTSAFQRFLKCLIHHCPSPEITQYALQRQDNQERGKVLIYTISK